MRKVNIIDRKLVLDDFYKMEETTFQYELPDGSMTEPVTRLCLLNRDSVAGVVFNTDTQKAILVRQFRYAGYVRGDGWITEVVAGKLEHGSLPEDDMKREVIEEVGYETKRIEYITMVYASPGGSTERIFLYYIEVDNNGKVADGGGLEHESEHIEIIEYSIDELKMALKNNLIPDAKSVLACQYLLAKH
ncbi:MAG: NUDIX hydrolase [Bacteroidetes bacterium]|nr:NUDIX hydrolase [Bacteroidota bacterium]